MLAGAAFAQADSENRPMSDQNRPASSATQGQNTRSWSTKHLTATGRMNENAVRASKLVGAPIKDASGKSAGVLRDIIVNPSSGRIDFALVSLQSAGNENTAEEHSKLVPVPWALLRASAGSSVYSANAGQPTFTLNAERKKLESAPAVDWSDLSKSEWRQRIFAYYGVTPGPAMGGAETPSGEMNGQGARQLPENNNNNPTPEPRQQQNQ